MKKFIALSVFATLFTMPSFAEPTELDKKTVASKAYVDTKQDKIPTDKVLAIDPDGTEDGVYVPAIVTTNAAGTELNGDSIGVLNADTLDSKGWFLTDASENANADILVPTVAAVAGDLNVIFDELDSKQDKLPAVWTSTTDIIKMASMGGETIDLINSVGSVGRRYITAGGSQPLTQKAGADNVILYINGRKTLAEYQTSNFGATGSIATTNQNHIKEALVSLELLKDVYNALHNEILNAAPTGTPGNVAMYDANNGALGDGIATANAPMHNATTGELENGANIATIAAVDTRQKKRTCAGYETGHENDPDYCWLWDFPDD